MADTTKVQKLLKECMEKYKDKPDSLWKCNTILEQIPTDTTKTDTSEVSETGGLGVRGPNYDQKTKAKSQKRPRFAKD